MRTFPTKWTVLPAKLANARCSTIQPSILLRWLNTIFCTTFAFTPDADVCLSEFIDDGCDLGIVYGYLRPWWHIIVPNEGFEGLRSRIRARMEEDYKIRTEAVVGSYITKSNIPPRRVWDLYSNRVLPYHAIRPKVEYGTTQFLPDNLWAVSHSWRPASERQSVLTTINGKAWRVPIPKETTLNAIRDELLILGAEYVFLDVLCLRQKDELLPEMESIRKREWRLDIPTIGYVYTDYTPLTTVITSSDIHPPGRPVVVYFNGLGMPFQNGHVNPRDEFHWLNRVWTLQETPWLIIFGGLKSKSAPINLLKPDMYWLRGVDNALLDRLAKLHNTQKNLLASVDVIRSRRYSNPVDQVACLAYLLRCPKLPIYDADMDVEVAWSLLVECMPGDQCSQLLRFHFAASGIATSASWRPSWQQVKAGDTILHGLFWGVTPLLHLDGSSPASGYKYGFDAYYHKPPVIEECYIHIPSSYTSGTNDFPYVRVPSVDGSGNKTARIFFDNASASIKPDIPYLLVCIGFNSDRSSWAVAQAVGSRRINGARGIELCKLWTVEMKGAFYPIKVDSFFTNMQPVLRRVPSGSSEERGENDGTASGLELKTSQSKLIV